MKFNINIYVFRAYNYMVKKMTSNNLQNIIAAIENTPTADTSQIAEQYATVITNLFKDFESIPIISKVFNYTWEFRNYSWKGEKIEVECKINSMRYDYCMLNIDDYGKKEVLFFPNSGDSEDRIWIQIPQQNIITQITIAGHWDLESLRKSVCSCAQTMLERKQKYLNKIKDEKNYVKQYI